MAERTIPAPASKRVLIAGKGLAGTSLADDVTADGGVVVGFLDDHNTDADVLGVLNNVAAVCSAQAVDVVYFAIPSASDEVVRNFVTQVPRPEVDLAIVPRTYKIVSREKVSLSDLTDVDVLDFVGRAPVKHDMTHARQLLSGLTALVTGGAGSIGSRIVAQLCDLGLERVIAVDRSESGAFHLGNRLADASNLTIELGDVQSQPRIEQLIERYQPDVVFHVAAYKHVPLMQERPVEAFNNNVWGTLNVMRSAARGGASRVVYVSTDKAVRPTNIMGATKRMGELFVHDLSVEFPKTLFAGVRFGNVLESEGSVMQTFRRQLNSGQNLTVTHPDITRYFMTIDEAASLVIQSASSASSGDLFVLDMGEPIRVADLAQSLIDAVNPKLKIEYIGLRPGEKMYEELSSSEGEVDSTSHPKIFVVRDTDHHGVGESTRWAEVVLDQSRNYELADVEVRQLLFDFGFDSLQ